MHPLCQLYPCNAAGTRGYRGDLQESPHHRGKRPDETDVCSAILPSLLVAQQLVKQVAEDAEGHTITRGIRCEICHP